MARDLTDIERFYYEERAARRSRDNSLLNDFLISQARAAEISGDGFVDEPLVQKYEWDNSKEEM